MMRYGLEKKRKKHQKNKVRSSFSLSDSGMTAGPWAESARIYPITFDFFPFVTWRHYIHYKGAMIPRVDAGSDDNDETLGGHGGRNGCA